MHKISGVIAKDVSGLQYPRITLPQGYCLISNPMSRMEQHQSSVEEPFDRLNREMKRQLKLVSNVTPAAYIETEYFGGVGLQAAQVWDGGKPTHPPQITDDGEGLTAKQKVFQVSGKAINEALKRIGVIAEAGLDEFDTLDLATMRSEVKIHKLLAEQEDGKDVTNTSYTPTPADRRARGA